MVESQHVVKTEPIPPKSVQIKTDKPRPYVCNVCTRSFARLEHLKRHERSHTKEKPFQCPVCERSFARRDLLLRHKQKLHASFTPPKSDCLPPSGPGVHTKRRASIAAARAAAPSSASISPPSTSSPAHSEGTPTNATPHFASSAGPQFPSRSWLPLNPLEHELDSLRSMAPPCRVVSTRASRSSSFSAASATSYVRFKEADSYVASHTPMEAAQEVGFSTPQAYAQDGAEFGVPDPIDLATPFSQSSFSMGSASGAGSDQAGCINPQLLSQLPSMPRNMLRQSSVSSQRGGSGGSGHFGSAEARRLSLSNDFNSPHFVDSPAHSAPLYSHPTDSPMPFMNHLNGNGQSANTDFTSLQSARDPLVPSVMVPDAAAIEGFNRKLGQKMFDDFIQLDDDFAVDGFSNDTLSTDLDFLDPTDPKRATVADLGGHRDSASTLDLGIEPETNWQPDSWQNQQLQQQMPDTSNWGNHQHHQQDHHQQASDPQKNWNWPEPHFTGQAPSMAQELDLTAQDLPESEYELSFPVEHSKLADAPSLVLPQDQRHPLNASHQGAVQQLPSSEEVQRYVKAYHKNFNPHLHFVHASTQLSSENMALVMAMAALGALYLGEKDASRRIYDVSRDCIRMYSDINGESASVGPSVPLWLVQASVLAVLYGLFHRSRSQNELAVQQAQRLGKLARAAGLHRPPSEAIGKLDLLTASVPEKWSHFLLAQKRVRTMYAVHAVAAIMTTMYGLPPIVTNQDLQCGAPSEEDLWTAPSADAWWAVVCERELQNKVFSGPNFGHCFAVLLSEQPIMDKIPQFVLLNLAYAIHLEIAGRRAQKQLVPGQQNRQANRNLINVGVVRAWETTWSNSPYSSLDPQSKFGPIMSDCVPLASLAYIRAYVDLIPVKERFWARDFAGMNRELDHMRQTGFTGLLASANYALDTVSLADRDAKNGGNLFLHTILCLVDCAFVLSETFKEIETHPQPLPDAEKRIVARATKVLLRSTTETSAEPLSALALKRVLAVLDSATEWPYVEVISEALTYRLNA